MLNRTSHVTGHYHFSPEDYALSMTFQKIQTVFSTAAVPAVIAVMIDIIAIREHGLAFLRYDCILSHHAGTRPVLDWHGGT